MRLEVSAALGARACATTTAAAAEDAAEPAEDVGQVEVAFLEADVLEAAGPCTGAGARAAERVVLLPLLRVGEQVVGLLHLLEALLGLRVAVVRVGMVLPRELAIRLLDLVCGGAPLDAEHLVRVTGRHGYPATTTRAGRRTLSPSR